MELLRSAAVEYSRYVWKEVFVTFSNKQSIRIVFKPSNFSHLAGIHKLTDLFQVGSSGYSARAIFKMALNGQLSYADLTRSIHFDFDERDRIESLSRISEVLRVGGKAVFGFDKSICRAQAKFRSTIIFYKDDGWSFFITFGVAADSSGTFYYPETVFYRFDEVYIRNLNIITITNIDIKRIVQKLKKN